MLYELTKKKFAIEKLREVEKMNFADEDSAKMYASLVLTLFKNDILEKLDYEVIMDKMIEWPSGGSEDVYKIWFYQTGKRGI